MTYKLNISLLQPPAFVLVFQRMFKNKKIIFFALISIAVLIYFFSFQTKAPIQAEELVAPVVQPPVQMQLKQQPRVAQDLFSQAKSYAGLAQPHLSDDELKRQSKKASIPSGEHPQKDLMLV